MTNFSQNPVCQLLALKYPIIQAGMVWCSGWKLAAASAEAGILGVLGAGSMPPEVFDSQLSKLQEATQKPYAINIPIFYAHAEQVIDIGLEKGVKNFITSGGNPKLFTGKLKAQGCTVIHVVSSLKFALKAQDAGADIVVAEGFEAGGHNGREETTTLCLIPPLADALHVPLVAAGGIASGRAMLAAMALGADGVQVGSAFAVARESSAHTNFKQRVFEAKEGETRLQLKKLTPVRMLKNEFSEQAFQQEIAGASPESLRELLGRGRSRRGILEGDLQEGELEIGQVSAQLQQEKTVAEIVQEMIEEFEKQRQKFM